MSYVDIEKRRAYHRKYRRKQREGGVGKEDYEHFHRMLASYTPEQRRLKHLRRRVRNKVRAYLVLGGRCIRCGETDFRLLTINHRNGDGSEDKKITESLYTQIKNFQRGDLELLCWNCQTLFEWERGGKNYSKEYKEALRKEVQDHKVQQDW